MGFDWVCPQKSWSSARSDSVLGPWLCMYVCVCTCVCMCVWARARARVRARAHTCMRLCLSHMCSYYLYRGSSSNQVLTNCLFQSDERVFNTQERRKKEIFVSNCLHAQVNATR